MQALFSKSATAASSATCEPITFVAAVAMVLVWAISGSFVGFFEVWKLVINTGTTVITLVMIFVLQNSQNRNSEALPAKLDELTLTSRDALNRFFGIERLGEKELKVLKGLRDQRAYENGKGENEGGDLNTALKALRNKCRAGTEPQVAV